MTSLQSPSLDKEQIDVVDESKIPGYTP